MVRVGHNREREGSQATASSGYRLVTEALIVADGTLIGAYSDLYDACLYACLLTAHHLSLSHSEGGFSCGEPLRKKLLRIPKQYTTIGDVVLQCKSRIQVSPLRFSSEMVPGYI
jgi:hypothetical protein